MDNGNGGPANRIAQGFEHISESVDFNPERLQDPNRKEQDPGTNQEKVGNNPNQNNDAYLDPSMLGTATVQAMQYGNQELNPALGQVISEGEAGMKTLTEDQVLATETGTMRFQKNGVTSEQEQRLDNLKKEPNLYRQSVDFIKISKQSLSSSFADRAYLSGGAK